MHITDGYPMSLARFENLGYFGFFGDGSTTPDTTSPQAGEDWFTSLTSGLATLSTGIASVVTAVQGPSTPASQAASAAAMHPVVASSKLSSGLLVGGILALGAVAVVAAKKRRR